MILHFTLNQTLNFHINDMNTEYEYWVPIPSYEEYYEISNFGNIRSLNRSILTKSGYLKPEKEKILTQRISNKGYLTVALSKNGQL